MIRLVNAAQSLMTITEKDWPQAVGFLLRIADTKLLPPEGNDTDPYRLVNILVGLIAASKKTNRPRLDEVVERMEKALQIRIDRVALTITSATRTPDAHVGLEKRWGVKAASALAPMLRRWIQAELSMMAFPFAGFGADMRERIAFIAIRFATLRLALMCHMSDDTPPDAGTVVKIVQSLSRFLDHLADPTFSRMAYTEAGWFLESRLRALVGDAG